MPPSKLHIDGRHGYAHTKIPNDFVEEESAGSHYPHSKTMNSSSWTPFPIFVRYDPIWQESQYAKSVSIADTMQVIDKYYIAITLSHFAES
jgi:hypothetical protein